MLRTTSARCFSDLLHRRNHNRRGWLFVMMMPVVFSGGGLGGCRLPRGKRGVDFRRIGGASRRCKTAKQHSKREHDNKTVT